jgi:hypothetical protein
VGFTLWKGLGVAGALTGEHANQAPKRCSPRMSPLLLDFWHEQHPNGHEQTMLDFKACLSPVSLI